MQQLGNLTRLLRRQTRENVLQDRLRIMAVEPSRLSAVVEVTNQHRPALEAVIQDLGYCQALGQPNFTGIANSSSE
jgi:hypothetical protein